MSSDNWLHFNLEDASQIAIGAFALAVPISFSEEAWRHNITAIYKYGNAFYFICLFFYLFMHTKVSFKEILNTGL